MALNRAGHVTVWKFCHLPLCRASRGFASDSWASCKFWGPQWYLWNDWSESRQFYIHVVSGE